MSSRLPSSCPWCGSAEIRRVLWGLPTEEPSEEWFLAGCLVPAGPRPDYGCTACGRMGTNLPLKLRAGQEVRTRLGPITASASELAWVRLIRAFLMQVLAEGRNVDLAEVIERVELPYELDDLPRLLALVEEDCARRSEASLVRIVAGIPGPVRFDDDDDYVQVMSQEEIYRILQEDTEGRIYLDDPDHPYKPS